MTCVPESNNQNGSTSYGGGSVAILRPALSDPMDCSPAGLYLWDFPGKITGVGCHLFLRGIFQTQGSNPGLLPCRWIFYLLSRQGSPSAVTRID